MRSPSGARLEQSIRRFDSAQAGRQKEENVAELLWDVEEL